MKQRHESFLSHFGMLAHPSLIVDHIWSVFREAGAYVSWNIHDFRAQFAAWDGSWSGLLTHIHLLWRMLVIGLLVVLVVEMEPLVAGLWRIARDIGRVLWMAVGLVESATEEIWSFLNVLIEDATSLLERMIGSGSERM